MRFIRKIGANLKAKISGDNYQPHKGSWTTRGLVLREKPSLDLPPEVKFAAFSDDRFFTQKHYKKFEAFLPKEFSIVGPPEEQDCFGFCLDVSHVVGREKFQEVMYRLGTEADQNLTLGDTILYYHDVGISILNHAGKYIGEGMVSSRWGVGSPVIQHPIDEVLPHYLPEIIGFVRMKRLDSHLAK